MENSEVLMVELDCLIDGIKNLETYTVTMQGVLEECHIPKGRALDRSERQLVNEAVVKLSDIKKILNYK